MAPRKGSQAWIQMVKRKVCPGCRHNRYNQGKGPAGDGGADIACEHCWFLTPEDITYNRTTKRYECAGYFRY